MPASTKRSALPWFIDWFPANATPSGQQSDDLNTLKRRAQPKTVLQRLRQAIVDIAKEETVRRTNRNARTGVG